jgi:hypothetical protein
MECNDECKHNDSIHSRLGNRIDSFQRITNRNNSLVGMGSLDRIIYWR